MGDSLFNITKSQVVESTTDFVFTAMKNSFGRGCTENPKNKSFLT